MPNPAQPRPTAPRRACHTSPTPEGGRTALNTVSVTYQAARCPHALALSAAEHRHAKHPRGTINRTMTRTL